MPQKLYVGNLPYRTTENDLRKLFQTYGPIHSLILITDKETVQSRGYSFVELDEHMAGKALYDLRNTEFNGRNLRISVATGRCRKSKASERNASDRRHFGKRTSEKRVEIKKNTAVSHTYMRRNRQTVTTDYVVADANNYG